MDFEALRRETDTYVKIYLLTQKQAWGSGVREGKSCTDEFYVCTAIQSWSQGAAGQLREDKLK